MPTSKEIKAYVKEHNNFVPDDCWIAHAKIAYREGTDFNPDIDIGTSRKPCAEHKRLALFNAMRILGAI